MTNYDLVTIRPGPPRSRFTLASASTAATVAAVSLTAAAARAEPLLHVEAGAYLTLTFGDRVDVGFGLRAHAWKEAGLPVASCSDPIGQEDDAAAPYVGGWFGLGFISGLRPHLLLGVDTGVSWDEGRMLGAQVGAVYRADAKPGWGAHLALDARYGILESSVAYWPSWADTTIALGIRGPVKARAEQVFPYGCPSVGRPLRGAADALLASRHRFRESGGDRICGDAAEIWAERAATEYASVSAFVQLADQLAVVGAPAALQRFAWNSARDEHRHAVQSAQLAIRLGGAPLFLEGGEHHTRPLAHGTAALERLAIEAWKDGCLCEQVAAQVALGEATLAADDAVRRVQQRIAHDEAEHADLAWEVLAWALRSGGEQIRAAVVAARDSSGPDEGSAEPSPSLSHYGCMSNRQRSTVAERVRSVAQAELTRLLG